MRIFSNPSQQHKLFMHGQNHGRCIYEFQYFDFLWRCLRCSELSSLFQFNLQEQRQLHLLQSQRLELEAEVRTPNFEAFML